MSWLKKLFGGGGPSLAQLEQLLAQKRYAEARLQAEHLQELDLPAAEIQQVTDLLQAAGDGRRVARAADIGRARRVANGTAKRGGKR
jgi:hypothetical protein